MQVHPELISVILDLLNRNDLLEGNKSLHALATRHSAQGLLGLQSSLEIVNCVTSVVFRSSTTGPEFPANDLTGPEYDAKIAAVPAISEPSKFPELASLTFIFHDEFSEKNWDYTDHPSYFLHLQSAVLAAASHAPLPALKSLTLTNLIAMPNDLYESPVFAEFLRPIEFLAIDVLGQDDLCQGVFASEPLGEFWAQMTAILSAAQSATFLRLRSNELIGVTPSLTFHSTPFPNLTSLVLESICFDSQDSAGCPESFILLHTDHLTRLVLIDCPLYGYDKVWAVVLANLGGNMRALRELSLGNVTLESVGDNSLQYAYEDMAWGFITLDAKEVRVDGDADRRALQKLMDEVDARKLANG